MRSLGLGAPPPDPRPDWVQAGHTFAWEPAWSILPRRDRPMCDTCLRPADQPHLENRPPVLASVPEPPRRFRYREND